MRRLRLHQILLALAAAAQMPGCAAPAAAPGDAGSAARSNANPSASGARTAETIRARLTNTENGLELRRWTIIDAPGRVAAALAKHIDGYAVDDGTLARLKRNGLRLARVPADQLDALAADLGGPLNDINEWHGQVCEWRSLLDRPIDEAGRAVAIDGLVRRYERGEFRLMIRSWNVQMEDGPFLHLEMLPRRRSPQGNNLRRLLGDAAAGGQSEQGFASMALDLQLQAGYAYVLVGESPQVDWPVVDGAAEAVGGAATTPPGDQISKARAARQTGPVDSFGPDANPPPTLGELLLPTQRDPPTRGVLVFVPRIAPGLFVPEQLATQGQP